MSRFGSDWEEWDICDTDMWGEDKHIKLTWKPAQKRWAVSQYDDVTNFLLGRC